MAFLRAVNVGGRRVEMRTARRVLEDLGYEDVDSFVNSGNLIFSTVGKTDDLEAAIRAAMETEFGFELTTFVRTGAEVRTLVNARPFGTIASNHTHFVLFPLKRMSGKEKNAVSAMSNDQDEVIVRGRDVHWLIRAKSTATSLGPREWKRALPGNPTTARNMTMLTRLAQRL